MARVLQKGQKGRQHQMIMGECPACFALADRINMTVQPLPLRPESQVGRFMQQAVQRVG